MRKEEINIGFEKEIAYCTFCPKLCRFACPVAQVECRETSVPTIRQEILYLLKSGSLELNSEVAEVFSHCAFCLHCRVYCQHLIEVPRIMEAARALALEFSEEEKLFLERLRAEKTPYGAFLYCRVREKIPAELRIPESQAIYFLGCAQTALSPDEITDVLKVFERLGIDYISFYDGEDFCCGMPFLNLGDYNGFKDNARRVAEKLQRYKLIVSGCPGCVYTLKVRYEEQGIRIPGVVKHITELVDEKLGGKSLMFNGWFRESAVFYHDPCYLGRYLGIYDAPRRVLGRALGRQIREFPWLRDDSNCCGGGGSLPFLLPNISNKIALRRLEEFRDLGGELLVTACPRCRQVFKKVDSKIEVMDIINILAYGEDR